MCVVWVWWYLFFAFLFLGCFFFYFSLFFCFCFLLLCEPIRFLGRRRVLEDARGRVAVAVTVRDDHKGGV